MFSIIGVVDVEVFAIVVIGRGNSLLLVPHALVLVTEEMFEAALFLSGVPVEDPGDAGKVAVVGRLDGGKGENGGLHGHKLALLDFYPLTAIEGSPGGGARPFRHLDL